MHSSLQSAHMPPTAGTDKLGSLYTGSLRLPTILFTFNYYLCHIPVSSLGQMQLLEKHTYALKNSGQHFQVIWFGPSAGAQPLTPDLSLFLRYKGARSLQGLAGRANRRGVTPIALHFQGSWSSLVLSNGHYSEPSYGSKIPAPKIEEYKNSID